MTINDVKKVIEQLRKEGNSDEQISYSFAMMFIDDKIPFEILEIFMKCLGYEITEDFSKLSLSEKKKAIKKIYGIR